MGNTKLSNIYGIERMIKNVPKQIEEYTDDIHTDIENIRKNNLYYSEMSTPGVITCLVLFVIGIALTFVPELVFGYIKISPEILETYRTIILVGGLFLLLVSIHGLGRMFFATQLKAMDKNINKKTDAFKKQFGDAADENSSNKLIDKISRCEDAELTESSDLDEKLFGSMTKIQSREKLLSKLVLATRVALPVILFVSAILVDIKCVNLGVTRVALSFVIMYLFTRRMSLLLEYKVGKQIRALMCIPVVLYGVIVYLTTKAEFEGVNFIGAVLLEKIPEGIRPFVGSGFVVCLLQVVVLILLVAFCDYYSERNYLRDGLTKGKTTHKKWYIYYSLTLYWVLISVFIVFFCLDRASIEAVDSIGNILLNGIIFGVIWRMISPIWPEGMSKTIRNYWGAKYSVAVEMFIVVLLVTVFFLGGFTFTLYSFMLLITMIIASWIAFAVMVHFWG